MPMTINAEQIPPLVERMIRIEAKLDTYNQNHQDHEGRLRVVEGQQAAVLAQLTNLAGLETRVQGATGDHESRIRGIERRMWVIAGASLVGGGLAGAMIQQLVG